MQYWTTSIFTKNFLEQEPKLRRLAWNWVLMADWLEHTNIASVCARHNFQSNVVLPWSVSYYSVSWFQQG